jgi:hypothetical protein
MKGDISKGTFDPAKHFHDVLMQQGRVLLDQEWNEQANINTHRTETGTKDIIGSSGGPLPGAGFAITPATGGSPPTGDNLKIGKGNYYVDGIICENDDDLLFEQQPDFQVTPLPVNPGTYIFYLDVWLRHITALEDSAIREVALGGPDTTTRTKTVWQVKYTSAAADAICSAGLPQAIIASSTGSMNARSEVTTASDDPCGLTTSGGYRRLQNQLYRIEIHIPGTDRAHTTFKWSRDNGSVLVKCTGQEAANKNNLLVTSTGRDDLLGFKSGNWVEVIHDDNDLLNTPGVLAQVVTVKGNMISIDPSTIKDPHNTSALFINIDTAKNPRVRRWDSEGDISLNTNDGNWIGLEDGVEVNFREGTFKNGDYWSVPARTAIADVEWPFTTPQLPKGIQHHYAQLAVATLNAGAWTVTDCRSLFPPLTALTSLYYVGGDGQEAMPGNPLPDSLKVGVANGAWIVIGTPVKFEILAGGGTLVPASGLVNTGADGMASCAWTLGADTSNLTLQVKASLLDDAGSVMPNHLPILFNAGFSIAQNVGYQPRCGNWVGEPPVTVSEALDQLCERKSEGGAECCSITVGEKGEYKNLLEAIFKLFEQRVQDVSLCLLPGNHTIDEEIDMLKHDMRFRTLQITGAAAYISMRPETLSLVAEKLILQGIELVVHNEKAQVRLSANELNIEHCTFIRNDADDGNLNNPLLIAQPLTEKQAFVNIQENRIHANVSLALDRRCQGYVHDNQIDGEVILQHGEQLEILRWEDINPDQRKLIEARLQQTLRVQHNNTALSICNNTVRSIVTNTFERFRIPEIFLQGNEIAIPGYQNLIISENVFKGRSSSFLAEAINLNNNQFLSENRHAIIACALGQKGIVTGNIDVLFNGEAGAIIDTLFSTKITTPNLITVL